MMAGFGMPVQRESDGADRIICFNGPDGLKVCEEIPLSDEVVCNDGLCSVFLTDLGEEVEAERIAGKYGLRAFVKREGGRVTKNLTGALGRGRLDDLAEDTGRSLSPRAAQGLRKVALGDIDPPPVCRVNPVAPQCEPYIASRNWHYLGPLRGWIRAESLGAAIRESEGEVSGDSGDSAGPGEAEAESGVEIVTTL